MKRPRRYLKRLHVDLNGYMADYEEMDFKLDVGTINKYAERSTVQEQYPLLMPRLRA